jgi:hypothetical protein
MESMWALAPEVCFSGISVKKQAFFRSLQSPNLSALCTIKFII